MKPIHDEKWNKKKKMVKKTNNNQALMKKDLWLVKKKNRKQRWRKDFVIDLWWADFFMAGVDYKSNLIWVEEALLPPLSDNVTWCKGFFSFLIISPSSFHSLHTIFRTGNQRSWLENWTYDIKKKCKKIW